MSIAAKFAVGVLRFIYFFIRPFPQKNRITILSRQSKKISIDIRLLKDAIEKNIPDAECVVLVRMLDSWTYAFHIIRQMYYIATSKVIVIDGFCIAASVLKHKKGTTIVQMWHASAAVKKFGYQTLGKPAGHSRELSEILCMHRNYDFVLAPSKATGKLFCEGFNVPEEKLRFYGLPRLSEITKQDEEWQKEARSTLNHGDGRELVLYVPTFRKGREIDAQQLVEALDSSRFQLIIKPHPLDRLDAGQEYVCREYSSTELLRICDRIITDYSALGVEAALLDKPLYYYVYDIDEYKVETGLNIDPLEEMPGCSSKDGAELARMMNGEYDYGKLEEFRNKYIEVPVDNCADRLAIFIGELLDGTDQKTS